MNQHQALFVCCVFLAGLLCGGALWGLSFQFLIRIPSFAKSFFEQVAKLHPEELERACPACQRRELQRRARLAVLYPPPRPSTAPIPFGDGIGCAYCEAVLATESVSEWERNNWKRFHSRGLCVEPKSDEAVNLRNVTVLDAAWCAGDWLKWRFQSPTRIEGFELEPRIGGELLSVCVAGREQLAVAGVVVSIVAIAQFHRAGSVAASPTEGWKIGPLLLQTVESGGVLEVKCAGFSGRMRPFGCQVSR